MLFVSAGSPCQTGRLQSTGLLPPEIEKFQTHLSLSRPLNWQLKILEMTPSNFGPWMAVWGKALRLTKLVFFYRLSSKTSPTSFAYWVNLQRLFYVNRISYTVNVTDPLTQWHSRLSLSFCTRLTRACIMLRQTYNTHQNNLFSH